VQHSQGHKHFFLKVVKENESDLSHAEDRGHDQRQDLGQEHLPKWVDFVQDGSSSFSQEIEFLQNAVEFWKSQELLFQTYGKITNASQSWR